MNQYQKISDFIESCGSITPMDAFQFLYITKLSTRIGEMNRMGYKIVGEWETHTDSMGMTSRYKRYRKVKT